MKQSGFAAIALAVAMTAACGGGTREDNNDGVVGTSGDGAPRGVQRFVHGVWRWELEVGSWELIRSACRDKTTSARSARGD